LIRVGYSNELDYFVVELGLLFEISFTARLAVPTIDGFTLLMS